MSAALVAATEIHRYPHIERLTEDSPLFLLREVFATEKVDGTNARFGLVNGEFQVGGRNIVFAAGQDAFGFHAWCAGQDLEARVRAANPEGADVTYFGEWFGPKIQKGIDYGTERRFLGFDVLRGGTYLDRADAQEAFDALGLPMVPIVYAGPLYSQDLDTLRARQTALGPVKDGNLWEGVVIRPAVTLRDRWGELLIAKLKNPAFDERRAPKEPRAPGDPADAQAVLAYCTAERLRHVLTGLRERGVDVSSVATTGEVIKAFVQDVAREATDLTDAQRSTIGKVAPAEARRLYFAHLEGRA